MKAINTRLASGDQKSRVLQCKGALTICFAVCTLGLSVSASAKKQPTLTTFDVPGGRSTEVTSMNPAGVIVGFSMDASQQYHGFLRARDGAITTFDVPGATETMAFSINPAGSIVGRYAYGAEYGHGFLRTRDGAITTFDVPGAYGTYATSIDPAGEITGFYFGAIDTHGFVRARDGTITTFDPPDGGFVYYRSTINHGWGDRGTLL